MLRFACPNCAKTVVATAELLGKKVKCPNCLTVFALPASRTPAATLPHVGEGNEGNEGDGSDVRTFAILGLAGGVLLFGVVAFGILIFRPAKPADQDVAAQPAPTAAVESEPALQPPAPTPPAPIEQPVAVESPAPAAVIATPSPLPSAGIDEAEGVVSKVEPAVVTIEVKNVLAGKAGGSAGSGFLIDATGNVVTNFHVVEGAVSAKVIFADGSETPVLGFRTVAVGKDLAVLAIDAQATTVTPLQISSDPPKKGSRVYAFGSPKGFKGTVSDGVVSALRVGGDFEQTDAEGFASFYFDADANWIQTSAPISSGNSGGPLVNRLGELVGVNTWVNDGQNLNFAISAAHVRELIKGRTPLKSLASLPTGPQTRIALARKDAKEKSEAQQSALDAAAAKAARDRETAREIAARNASEERAEAEQRSAAQLELNRLNDRMVVVRTDLRTIETQGETLTKQRADIFARGQAVTLRGNQMRDQITFGRNRLAVIANVIRSRDLAAKGGPKFLDNEPATTAQLQQESARIEVTLPALMQEAGGLEAAYIQLDQQARALSAQIEAKVGERTRMTADLKELERQYSELLAKASPEGVQPAAPPPDPPRFQKPGKRSK